MSRQREAEKKKVKKRRTAVVLPILMRLGKRTRTSGLGGREERKEKGKSNDTSAFEIQLGRRFQFIKLVFGQRGTLLTQLCDEENKGTHLWVCSHNCCSATEWTIVSDFKRIEVIK